MDKKAEQDYIKILENANSNVSVKIAGKRQFPASYRFGPHSHNEAEIICAESGICIIQFEDNKYVYINKKEGIIIYPNTKHTFIIDDKSQCQITQLMLQINWINEMQYISDTFIFIKHMLSNIKYEKINHCVEISDCTCRINRKISDEHLYPLYIAELYTVLSESIKNTNKEICNVKSKKLKQIIEYINANIFDQIVIEDICKQFSLSSRYLRKRFQEMTGYNVNYYINLIRINKSKELIASHISITQISYQIGFSSSQYFTKVFKKITGITPSQYKMQYYRSKDL